MAGIRRVFARQANSSQFLAINVGRSSGRGAEATHTLGKDRQIGSTAFGVGSIPKFGGISGEVAEWI